MGFTDNEERGRTGNQRFCFDCDGNKDTRISVTSGETMGKPFELFQ